MSSSIDDNDNGNKTNGTMKKFMFDTNDFDNTKPMTVAAPVFSEEQIALASERSHTEGRLAGLREAKEAQEEQIAKSIAQMTAQLDKLIEAEERREIEKSIDAIKLTMRVTHKLMPQLSNKYAIAEIERVILDALAARHEEPRVAITVSPQHLDMLKTTIDGMALQKGFAGKLILLADDHMAGTDCRVEWADGGAERLYERLMLHIENEFAQALAGLNATLNPNNNNK